MGNKLILFLFLAIAGPVAIAGEFSEDGGFSASAGMEYQVLSQEYYDAVIDTSQLDPIETWLLSTDEINDLIFRSSVDYRYKARKNFVNLLADIEYSCDRLLGRAEGLYSLGDYNSGMKLFGKYEDKSPNDNDESGTGAYRYIQTYLKARQRISSRVRLHIKPAFELVSFTEEQSSVPPDTGQGDYIDPFQDYDYSILSGRLGGELALTEFSQQIYWTVTYQHRVVPDSAEAEYDNIRVNVEYSRYDINGQFALTAEVEHKDYAQPDNKNDFDAFFVRGRFSRMVGRGIDWGMSFNYDNYRFSLSELVNRNYQLFRVKFQALRQFTFFSAGPFGRLEFRSEQELNYEGEEYGQWEIGAAANILDMKSLFFDAELSAGKRNYRGGDEITSSYSFVSASVMINYAFWKYLSFNLVFDGDFETHDKEENNSRLYLLSTGLSARF